MLPILFDIKKLNLNLYKLLNFQFNNIFQMSFSFDMTSRRNISSSKAYNNKINDGSKNESKLDDLEYRESQLQIQMLSKGLYDQLFKNTSLKAQEDVEEDEGNIARSMQHLQSHELWGKESSKIPDVVFKPPSLLDSNLLKHFNHIGVKFSESYKNLILNLIKCGIPEKPSEWQLTKGWTRYNEDGTFCKVGYPECDALVFDVEVCVQEGPQPTMATAMSDKFWYSWCSDYLMDRNKVVSKVKQEDLIPMEDINEFYIKNKKPRVIVGHNVSYDRLRTREQYHIKNSGVRFVDTMSLNIAVCGLIYDQKMVLMKNKNLQNKIWTPWMAVGCENSLKNAFKFHCKSEKELEKDVRNVFVKGSMDDIRNDFQNLMTYCANDVVATTKLLSKLFPKFLNRFPHPVTLSGMLEMGTTFLPVTNNWNKYIEASEKEYNKFEDELNQILLKHAKEALTYNDNKMYENDLWLWNLEWALPKVKVKKLQNYPMWYRKLCKTTGLREGTPEPEKMTTSLRIVPKILRLTWNGFPLHHESKQGWGYLMPNHSYEIDKNTDYVDYFDGKKVIKFPLKALHKLCPKPCESNDKSVTKEPNENVLLEDDTDWESFFSPSLKTKKVKKEISDGFDIKIPGVLFVPLPHKDGANNKVGNPLAKDYLRKLEDKVLSSDINEVAELVLKTTKTISYWRNNRDRILNQINVSVDHSELPMKIKQSEKFDDNNIYGIILPQVIVSGTITRRAVERTWMTASNAYQDRIGSELKAMIEAPPGYHFVGADVDSQELWIAAILGDAYFAGHSGATALGWMTLQGKKSEGTDMHSRTAAQAEISRDQAKVINYGRIYGAGLKFVQQLLQQFNPNLSESDARNKASSLISTTKGEKCWYLNKSGEDAAKALSYEYNGEPLTRKQVNSFVRRCEKYFMSTFHDVVEQPSVWMGGTESFTFNCLEAVVRYKEPRTPVLGARITRSLEPEYVDDDYMTSRMNWVVQSSAVDYLHLLLTSMQWLCDEYDIDARFCISIHDEVRYLVASEDRYRAGLALQIANLHTRSIFALRLGMNDLPLSVAFFSGVDIDKVLRKEPHLECITPSNPLGLKDGYGIPPGETLDIYQILQITKGKL